MLNDDTLAGADGGHGLEPWQLRLVARDDALAPVVAAGQTVVVDCSERELVDGAIVAVRQGGELDLWLHQVGFAGLGCRIAGRTVCTLVGLGGTFRLRGPVDSAHLRVVGRIVEPVGVAALMQQRGLLLGLRETTRELLLRRPAEPAALAPAWMGAGTVEEVAQGLAASLRSRSFADRFALERRVDAIDARLGLLDELIAAAPADGLGDALGKLETLRALQPEGGDDLATRLLASALAALQQMAADGARPGRAAGLATGAPAEPLPQPLELVGSPRRRR